MLELKSDLKPRQMIGLNDRTRLTVYLALQNKILFIRFLKKIGYYFKKNKINSTSFAIQAFQRRFRQKLINGIIDQECLIISNYLVKKINK